jgi:hypothetical protein
MQGKTILLILFFFTARNSFGQNADVFQPDSIRKEIYAVQTDSSLQIDGLLNEPEWKLQSLRRGLYR